MTTATETKRRNGNPAEGASPPASSPLMGALLRRWWLVLAPALAFLAVAIAAGLLRAPSYTTTTQSNVGSIDVQAQALPGFVEGAKSLAASYSRIVVSDRIVEPTARRVGLSPATVRERLSSTPVPSSQIVTVTATAPSGAEATSLANAATDELTAYIESLEGSASRSADLLDQYRERIGAANRLDAAYERLRLARRNSRSAETRAQLLALKTRADTDRLRAQSLSQLYIDARSDDEGAAEISLLNRATNATSDRGSVLQRLAFVGFFGGLVVGVGLVALGEGRRRRSHLSVT